MIGQKEDYRERAKSNPRKCSCIVDQTDFHDVRFLKFVSLFPKHILSNRVFLLDLTLEIFHKPISLIPYFFSHSLTLRL